MYNKIRTMLDVMYKYSLLLGALCTPSLMYYYVCMYPVRPESEGEKHYVDGIQHSVALDRSKKKRKKKVCALLYRVAL